MSTREPTNTLQHSPRYCVASRVAWRCRRPARRQCRAGAATGSDTRLRAERASTRIIVENAWSVCPGPRCGRWGRARGAPARGASEPRCPRGLSLLFGRGLEDGPAEAEGREERSSTARKGEPARPARRAAILVVDSRCADSDTSLLAGCPCIVHQHLPQPLIYVCAWIRRPSPSCTVSMHCLLARQRSSTRLPCLHLVG